MDTKNQRLYPVDDLHLAAYLLTVGITHVKTTTKGRSVFYHYAFNAELKKHIESYIFDTAVVHPKSYGQLIKNIRADMQNIAQRG